MKPLFGKLLGTTKPLLGKPVVPASASPFAPLRLPTAGPAKTFAPLAPAVAQPKALEPAAQTQQARPVPTDVDANDQEPCLGVIWGWKPWSLSATVIRVLPGSVGERLGLSPGDLLLGMDGRSLVRAPVLSEMGFRVGQRVQLEVSIRGRCMTKECVLEVWTEEMCYTAEDKEKANRII